MENIDNKAIDPARLSCGSDWIILFDLEILLREWPRGGDKIRSIKLLLKDLSCLYSLCLLAGRKEAYLADILPDLRYWGLESIFPEDRVISASQLKYPVHDPQSLRVAAALAGGIPQSCILASPDPLLLIAATAAGMKTVPFFSLDKSALDQAFKRESQAFRREPLHMGARVIDEDKSPTYILKGRLVTMNQVGEVFDEGKIVISQGKIVQIAIKGEDILAEFRDAVQIDTAGTIYPGLIDLHNHFVYNVLPLWPVSKRYTNRNQWSKIRAYSRDISLPIRALADSAIASRAIVRYVEVKAILGGTTTGQGIRTQVDGGVSIFKGAMRNAEETDDPRLPEAGTRVPDLGLSEKDIQSFRNALKKRKAYFYHLAEGVGATARKRFLQLKTNDLVQESLVGIHSLGLDADDLISMAGSKAKIVWSPFSNLLLYGRTLDLKSLKDSAIPFSIGCDWSPSGGKNLLVELKVARHVNEVQGSVFSSQELVRAVTSQAARVLGWDEYLGSLKPEALADLIVVAGTSGDPYDHLIDAIEKDLILVVVHGRPRYGKKCIMESILRPEENSLEKIAVGGEERLLYLHSSDSNINDLTLDQSQKILTQAMADLPSFREAAKEENRLLRAMGLSVEDKFRVLLDNEVEEPGLGRSGLESSSESSFLESSSLESSLLEAMPLEIDWSKMAERVDLDGLIVDSPSYWDRLDLQANIDDGLKQALKNAYTR